MIFRLLLVIFLSSVSLSSKVAILTIPKSGSHLVVKAISLIVEEPFRLCSPTSFGTTVIYCDHLWPRVNYIQHSEEWEKAIFIRDPRDVIVSMMYWIDRASNWIGRYLTTAELKYFRSLSHDEKLTYLIHMPDKSLGICFFVKTALNWMRDPEVRVFRFEDLIGERGGGTRESQLTTIGLLADHLGYKRTEDQIASIADNLFGNTATFRSGEIGSWRHEFTEEHKRLFKEKLGNALIQLGYEKDLDW